jgi:hypothetical protein
MIFSFIPPSASLTESCGSAYCGGGGGGGEGGEGGVFEDIEAKSAL